MRHATLRDQLIFHEGERLFAYQCTAGVWTIGVGRAVGPGGKGITQKESRYLLQNDINECFEDLQRIFPHFLMYDQQRQWALIDLRFNLGPNRFRGFRRMIEAIHMLDWETAAAEALDSAWARQVQRARVDTIIHQLRG